MTEQDNMTMQQHWNIYRLFPTYAEAEAAGMGQEWQDAEDAIHVHDYDLAS